MVDQVTLVDGSVITDDINPTTGIRANGHRNWFIKALQSVSIWASRAQAYAAQAQAAAAAGGGTIFPVLTSADAGKLLRVATGGTSYEAVRTPTGTVAYLTSANNNFRLASNSSYTVDSYTASFHLKMPTVSSTQAGDDIYLMSINQTWATNNVTLDFDANVKLNALANGQSSTLNTSNGVKHLKCVYRDNSSAIWDFVG